MAATTRSLPGHGPLLSSDEARREAEELLGQFVILYPSAAVVKTAIRGWATHGLAGSTRISGLVRDLRTHRDLLRGFSARSPVRDGARRRSVPGPLTSSRSGLARPVPTGRVSRASTDTARLEVAALPPDRHQSPSRSGSRPEPAQMTKSVPEAVTVPNRENPKEQRRARSQQHGRNETAGQRGQRSQHAENSPGRRARNRSGFPLQLIGGALASHGACSAPPNSELHRRRRPTTCRTRSSSSSCLP